MASIPVVDIGLTEQSNECDWSKVAKEVDDALSGIGFVYLKGHGIPEKTLENAFDQSKKFFELDLQIKDACVYSVEGSTFGYNGRDPKLTIGNKYRESFNVTPNPDGKILEALDTNVEPLVSSLLQLAKDSQPTILRLLSIFVKSLQLETEDYFSKRCIGLTDTSVLNLTRLKTNIYPYLEGMEAGTERCSTHADFGLITFLWQDVGGGLEVLTGDGKWISAPCIPGTILVNSGNLLSFWSGGRYPATIHRVGVSEHEIEHKLSRQSMAYFVIPDDEVLIAPLLPHHPNYTGEIPASVQAVTVQEYMKKQLETVYNQLSSSAT